MEDGSSPINSGDLITHSINLMLSYEYISNVKSCTFLLLKSYCQRFISYAFKLKSLKFTNLAIF